MMSISRGELASKFERGDNFVLLDVLPRAAYDRIHLPGAINVPLGRYFDQDIQVAVPRKDTPIVVYGKNVRSDTSKTAALRMERLGYSHLFTYQGGKDDWRAAGLWVARSGEAPHTAAPQP